FGFTGTPIFTENATYKQVDGTEASFRTTQDIFEKELHSYTITNAIDDRNVLRFHVDYYKPEKEDGSEVDVRPGQRVAKEAVVRAILEKHDRATNNRRFNAIL